MKVGTEEGLKRDGTIHCNELVSLSKASLTDCVGALFDLKTGELNTALQVPLGSRANNTRRRLIRRGQST